MNAQSIREVVGDRITQDQFSGCFLVKSAKKGLLGESSLLMASKILDSLNPFLDFFVTVSCST